MKLRRTALVVERLADRDVDAATPLGTPLLEIPSMIRLLMASTAVAAVLATGALAQDSSSSAMDSSMMASSSMPMDSSMMASSSMPMDSSMMDPSAMPTDSSMMSSSVPMDSSMMSSQMSTASSMDSSMMETTPPLRTPITITSGYNQIDTDQLATKIIGQPVYDGPNQDADNLGNISDLVVNGNGDIAAVVIGVGGFLGIGEKQVAVDFSSLKVVLAADNTKRFVVQTSKDELTNAPDFKTVDKSPSEAVSDMSMSSGAEQASSVQADQTMASSSSAAQ